MGKRSSALVAAAFLASCNSGGSKSAPENKPAPPSAPSAPTDAAADVELPPLPTVPRPTLGLPPVPRAHRRIAPALLAIGEALFAETTPWGERACASCHRPDHGFSGSVALEPTSAGKTNLRHAPSLFNLAYSESAYWDGRAEGPDAIERMLPGHVAGQLGVDLDELAIKLDAMPRWRAMFARAGAKQPTGRTLADALAAFVRTRFSPPSAWDRHEAGERGAVSEAAIRGAAVFNARAGCALCHPPPLYTNFGFHRTALAADVGPPDVGRGRVSGEADDQRAFKTPTLRNTTQSAPYFHNGAITDLDEAIAIELSRSSAQAAALTDAERADLAAFVRSLSP